jgi:hypothetical protein
LLLVLDAANSLHHGVAPHLATRCTAAITRHSAEPSFRFRWGEREH